MTELARDQQTPPVRNDKPAVWQLVIADMQQRDEFGRQKYGTPLQPNNGRDALVDAYQEVLDLAVYLRQEIEERRTRRLASEFLAKHAEMNTPPDSVTRDVLIEAAELLKREGF